MKSSTAATAIPPMARIQRRRRGILKRLRRVMDDTGRMLWQAKPARSSYNQTVALPKWNTLLDRIMGDRIMKARWIAAWLLLFLLRTVALAEPDKIPTVAVITTEWR